MGTAIMKLNNGKELKVMLMIGLELQLKEDMSVEELEQLLSEENLRHVELLTSIGEIYGKYNNLKLSIISKYVQQDYILFSLEEKW